MAVAALFLYALWFALAFVLRTVRQRRQTGDSGWRARSLPGTAGSVDWRAGLLFVVALLVGLGAPIADLVGLEPLVDATWLAVAGTVVAAIGVLLTYAAQVSMGDSWRIGVDPGERTALVTAGAFEIVRNPIFSAMLVTAVGLAAMVPNVVAVAGLVALVVALELQVRGVEEPYLRQVHGDAYTAYEARVGRFAPGLGRAPR